MCQCIWTRVVWLFGQLIGPCSRNNFVANLLTVLPVLPASWSTCFIVAFIKRSTDKTRTFIFLLNALDNARSACLLSSPALCRPANGHAPLDTPRGLWTRRCCTCRCGRQWRNDGICTTICKYTRSVSPFPPTSRTRQTSWAANGVFMSASHAQWAEIEIVARKKCWERVKLII